MNKTSTRLVSTIVAFVFYFLAQAQCPGGYTSAQLNWDNLDFLPSNNVRYTSFYPSAAFPYTQNFAIGTRALRFIMSPMANLVLNGENGTNTAHTGSLATAGDDVQFTTTASSDVVLTLAFDADVANIKFSLFDLDINQRATITAVNAAGTAQTILLDKANAASPAVIVGSGTIGAAATAGSTNYGDNNNMGTMNITIGGPAKQVIITLNNAAGDVWLSDINACITGTFPNNYQRISRPFTGQPQYVLTVVNNNIYYVDPSNGQGYFLFKEPGHDRLNSMAYDPYKRVVYYTYSLTDRAGLDPRVDKVLKKYDVDSKTISVVSANVNNLGIPTYESGVESGAASFYNGSLYLGVEGYTGTTGSGSYAAGRKSTIWKIDFDAAGNPITPAVQVFGVTADDGVDAQNIHDWSDFGVSNGVLYDFDGSQSGDIDYFQFDMFTGNRIRYAPAGGVIPRQVSIGWDEKLYNVDATISLYNGTNGVGTQFTMTAPIGPTMPTGGSASWGDAAGPYRPFLDFGDAPASYDPDPWSPACHDTLTPSKTKLRLGPAEDLEWLKKGFTTIEDNFEDGLAFVPIFSSSSGTYTARVTTFNNSGSSARLCAWLDFNGNGVFDAAEGITPINVPSSGAIQTFNLIWPSAPSTLANGSLTYLRIRITKASFGMTEANATGYYSTGEVEDYKVLVDNGVLPLHILSFDSKIINENAVQLGWSAQEEGTFTGYDIQRSADGITWETITFIAATPGGGQNEYIHTDGRPLKGRSWYRLLMKDMTGEERYSDTKMVTIGLGGEKIFLSPNPAVSGTTLTISGHLYHSTALINIIGLHGATVYSKRVELFPGNNEVALDIDPALPGGVYLVRVVLERGVLIKKLVVWRN